jgi:DDE superfamily endonuclease
MSREVPVRFCEGPEVKFLRPTHPRIGQQGSLTRIWAKRGSRPTAPRGQRYQSAYLFGAVCSERGVGAGLVLPRANVHAMNLHLQEISTQVSPGAFAVLTLDGAGWHQGGDRLTVPDNIGLLHLPPYSPELNPVENIWEFLRHNDLSNRVYATYEAIVDACCIAWNKLIAASARSPLAITPNRSAHESLGITRSLPGTSCVISVQEWVHGPTDRRLSQLPTELADPG